jgi:hypothetical protein
MINATKAAIIYVVDPTVRAKVVKPAIRLTIIDIGTPVFVAISPYFHTEVKLTKNSAIALTIAAV